MPKLGDIEKAKDVGFGSNAHKCVWAACLDCKKERWVLLRNGVPQSVRCHPCGARHSKIANPVGFREKSPHWKGGRHVTAAGYVHWVIPVDDPMIVMADARGRVSEHRLVVARSLGRPLERGEHVHHRNGNKHDNRIENLEVMTLADHAASHRVEIHSLRLRVQELEKEIEKFSRA